MIKEFKLSVPQRELDRLNNLIKQEILVPTLKEIETDTKSDIQKQAHRFRGTSNKSLSDKNSVSTRLDRKLKLKLSPAVDHFIINKEGYLTPQYKYVTDDPELFDWVAGKYHGANKDQILAGNEPLLVRAKDDFNLKNTKRSNSPPLGHPSRDFFGMAFSNLITNKSKYGMR